MKTQLLQYLEKDARLTTAQLATLLNSDEQTVADLVRVCEAEGSILSYRTLVNWDKAGKEAVSALIELKIAPIKDKGFDFVAERISHYPQVKSVYLMSGGFDLALTLECATMREVAVFVAEKLATIEGVTGTATHFVLQKYKDSDTVFDRESKDERGNTW